MTPDVSQAVLAELAPTGVLRAGINLSNFLLVSGKSATGEPEGVAPDMARAIADRLGVPVAYVTFPRPGELADAASKNIWDIGLIAAEPARAEAIAFSARLRRDRGDLPRTPGLKDHQHRRGRPPGHQDRDRSPGRLRPLAQPPPRARRADPRRQPRRLLRSVRSENLDALAGLRPRLLQDIEKLPGARILDGKFTAVQQAVGTAKANDAGARFLHAFVEDAKASGLVARLIERHHIRGLSVAPPG